MQIPNKKLKNGFELPVFGLGTYQTGIGADEKDVLAIKTAVELGVTHIDTAESYTNGHSEELIGEAIKTYNRKSLFLVSKVQESHLNYHDIKKAVSGSLKRLQTDYLDLYLLHRYPAQDNLTECLKAMEELKEEGLIKNIGISNFNLEHTKQAQELCKFPIVATQVHYNLEFREVESTGLLEYCTKNDIMVIAWRPVNKGANSKSGVNLASQGIEILDQMCVKYGKTPAQISINWLISQPNVVTLAKSSSIEHLKENLGSVGWEMQKDDIEALRKNFPNQKLISDTVPLA